jgi:methylated-DNA-[protein]-cysteine S-methyltransferase
MAFCLFDTAVGRCGIAWSGVGVTRFQWPEANDAATRARLVRKDVESEPPPAIQSVIERVRSLFTGGMDDLSDVPVDLEGRPEFHRRVWEAILKIPPGRTTTYGELARSLGDPGAAQAVGQALGRNPIPVIIPCHRVLGANGWRGGFTAPGGVDTKTRLLLLEGVDIRPPPDLFDPF